MTRPEQPRSHIRRPCTALFIPPVKDLELLDQNIRSLADSFPVIAGLKLTSSSMSEAEWLLENLFVKASALHFLATRTLRFLDRGIEAGVASKFNTNLQAQRQRDFGAALRRVIECCSEVRSTYLQPRSSDRERAIRKRIDDLELLFANEVRYSLESCLSQLGRFRGNLVEVGKHGPISDNVFS